MASPTRSTRRAEGRDNQNAIAPMRSRPTANLNHAAAGGGGGGGGGIGKATRGGGTNRGMKRGLEDPKEGERPKKTRIGAIEAVARDRGTGNRNGGMKGAGNRDKITPRAHKAAPNAKPEDTNHRDLTKHQAKVINGIKHELDRLQPQGEDADNGKEGGRKLRSQEASRYKSELAAYFPEYDEIIGNEEKEECKFPESAFMYYPDTNHCLETCSILTPRSSSRIPTRICATRSDHQRFLYGATATHYTLMSLMRSGWTLASSTRRIRASLNKILYPIVSTNQFTGERSVWSAT